MCNLWAEQWHYILIIEKAIYATLMHWVRSVFESSCDLKRAARCFAILTVQNLDLLYILVVSGLPATCHNIPGTEVLGHVKFRVLCGSGTHTEVTVCDYTQNLLTDQEAWYYTIYKQPIGTSFFRSLLQPALVSDKWVQLMLISSWVCQISFTTATDDHDLSTSVPQRSKVKIVFFTQNVLVLHMS